MLHDPKTKNDSPLNKNILPPEPDDVPESNPDEIIESDPELVDEDDFDEDNTANDDGYGDVNN